MSRHTAVDEKAVAACEELVILASSPKVGLALARSQDGRRVFATGHSEYDRDTLLREYVRDVEKGLPIEVPENYFPDDDPDQLPKLRWHAHANLLFSNWLNYFVYQETPYELSSLSGRRKEGTT
jgi:homoserine O-succinyltransferase